MLRLMKMAWRNLGRHRGRTLLSLSAVICGVLVVILFKGYVDGMMDNMNNLTINLNSGHVRIIRPEYKVKERLLSLSYPVGENGKSYSELITDIRKLPGVTHAMGRIRFGMMLVVGDEHEGILGIGAETHSEDQVSHIGRYLTGQGAGRLPVPGKQEVVLGLPLMNKLHLKLGDKVNAVFSTSLGSFKIATFQIVGQMASGIKMLDEGVAYLPLDQAMQLLEMDNMATEIVVFGDNAGKTNQLNAELRKYLAAGDEKLQAVPWNQYNDLIVSIEKMKSVYDFIYFLMVVLASFVVFNTLMMIVSERTREIGMLTALGMTPSEIKQLFLYEGAMVAAIGSFIGTLLGGVLNWIMSIQGIDMSKVMGMMPKELAIFPIIYPSYSIPVLLFSFVLGFVVTVLAAYLPARRAALLKPTEALRTI